MRSESTRANAKESDAPLLQVRGLTHHFPARGGRHRIVHALENVSFTLTHGRTLGLVGESGCGKSTCARCIVRILNPSAGQVLLDGQDITHIPQKRLLPVRRKMQMVFQDPYTALNARMTVRDIVAEPLRAQRSYSSGETREMVGEMLSRVGLTREHENRYAHELSGGQRQRVGIARALILKPALVLCDEPISALDVSIQAQVINLLRDFQQELGLAYLFIAHDLSMVRYVSDSVGVMYMGELVELSDGGDLYTRPLHPYTQGLLESIPIPNPRVARENTARGLTGDIASPIDPPPGCRFHTRCPRAAARCKSEPPLLKEAAPGHWTACHLV
ncbi:MAG: ATP-binding cassette domain-containing protein [Oscillospiraceae bacterium]|jgi:oligopeptide transport system ATP-binding protein|nr:ATP-binding cassette domain-containing protein [Oscillospiraceae bacterium]